MGSSAMVVAAQNLGGAVTLPECIVKRRLELVRLQSPVWTQRGVLLKGDVDASVKFLDFFVDGLLVEPPTLQRFSTDTAIDVLIGYIRNR